MEDRLRLAEHCVEFAFRLHPNQTVCKPGSNALGGYPNLGIATEIIPPNIDAVINTARSLFAFILGLGDPPKKSPSPRVRVTRARQRSKSRRTKR